MLKMVMESKIVTPPAYELFEILKNNHGKRLSVHDSKYFKFKVFS